MTGQNPRPPKTMRAFRAALAANTALVVCLTLLLYFLFSFSFFIGDETLTAHANDNLIRRESTLAVQYLRACMPDDPVQIDMDSIAAFRAHFSAENSNFSFLFWQKDDTQSGGKALVLSNYTAEHYSAAYENYRLSDLADIQNLLDGEANEAFSQFAKGLLLDGYIRDPLTAHDEFYRVQQTVRFWNAAKYPLLLLFLLSAVLEGRLWVELCEKAAKGLLSPALSDLRNAPMYALFAGYLLALANGLYFLRRQAESLYLWATFAAGDDIRPPLYLFLLLLLVLAWLTTVFVSVLRAQLAEPQWFERTVLYRAVRTPSIERRLQTWLTLLLTAEFAAFLVLFLRLHAQDGRLFVWIDAAVSAVILLMTAAQAKSTSAYMRAAHRIAEEKTGTVPTEDLRGKSLAHVQNINFLSRSAGEQTQLRFVNEAFSTKLIRSVSQSLREPLTAVTAEAERLQSGTLTEAQMKESIIRVNALSQDLKKSIEDLLRIAGASAEESEATLVPTDARLMIEQTVGEFYDRFHEKHIDLVQTLPQDSLQFPADGTWMWTVFESILDEFLLYAVPGTRVFLHASQTQTQALLRFQGTARPDVAPQRHSLALPTAKVFTEKQGGTYHDTLSQDILTVELQFPLCKADE